jgi:hypothetical protein
LTLLAWVSSSERTDFETILGEITLSLTKENDLPEV